jgi:hypothetical protein
MWWGSGTRPGRFTSEKKTRYLLYRMLGGPQCRSALLPPPASNPGPSSNPLRTLNNTISLNVTPLEGFNFLENICFHLSFPSPSYLVTVTASHNPNITCNDRLLIGRRVMHETVIMCQKWKNVITAVWLSSIQFYNIDLIRRCSKGL